jgi:hypothetical protein
MVLRVSLKVSLDYELLASEVAYIELASSVRLDTTGFFRFIPDSVVTTDGTVFAVTKLLGDIQVMTDATSISVLKPLADGLAMADAQTVSALKALADSITQPDAKTIGVSKALGDIIQATELIAKVLSRPLADALGMTDDETVEALKGLSDSAVMQDSLTTLLLFIRDFNDQVSVPDLRATLFIPSTKVEQITVADDDFFSYQKNIADGFAMNDGSEAVDGSQYSIHKGISNVAFVGDLRSSFFTTSRLESTTVADAGLVSAQNYCDPTYFAEDYVGVSQSF